MWRFHTDIINWYVFSGYCLISVKVTRHSSALHRFAAKLVCTCTSQRQKTQGALLINNYRQRTLNGQKVETRVNRNLWCLTSVPKTPSKYCWFSQRVNWYEYWSRGILFGIYATTSCSCSLKHGSFFKTFV